MYKFKTKAADKKLEQNFTLYKGLGGGGMGENKSLRQFADMTVIKLAKSFYKFKRQLEVMTADVFNV
ncbi:hypothetical protein Lrub_1432 [Legionella rubrilucens]|uniref:Uncharacterized protein n=1 Tax=Legionella rubrilucens TaxID=458 RepID=A0A0W0XWV5_9GAMM|nr:hypothetical protein Lrub_1432 [Legionella rubrilucens]